MTPDEKYEAWLAQGRQDMAFEVQEEARRKERRRNRDAGLAIMVMTLAGFIGGLLVGWMTWGLK